MYKYECLRITASYFVFQSSIVSSTAIYSGRILQKIPKSPAASSASASGIFIMRDIIVFIYYLYLFWNIWCVCILCNTIINNVLYCIISIRKESVHETFKQVIMIENRLTCLSYDLWSSFHLGQAHNYYTFI